MFVVYARHFTDSGMFEFSAPRIVHSRGLLEVREWIEEQLAIAAEVPTRKHTTALLETKAGNFRLSTPQVVSPRCIFEARQWLAAQLTEIEKRFKVDHKTKLAARVREMEKEELAKMSIDDFDVPIVSRRSATAKSA